MRPMKAKRTLAQLKKGLHDADEDPNESKRGKRVFIGEENRNKSQQDLVHPLEILCQPFIKSGCCLLLEFP